MRRDPFLTTNVAQIVAGPVGHGSKIGADTVVIHDVQPNSTVVGNRGHPVRVEGRRPEGADTDLVHLPDRSPLASG